MKLFAGVFIAVFAVQLCHNCAQAAPHMSSEDSEDSSSSETDSEVNVTPVDMTSHEVLSHEPQPSHMEATTAIDTSVVTAANHEGDKSPKSPVAPNTRVEVDVGPVALNTRSSEESDTRETDESDEDETVVKFPKAGAGHCPTCPKGPSGGGKTESLCPARPEEITKIEAECAEEFRQWKEMRAKKNEQTTTCETPIHLVVEVMNMTSEVMTSSSEDLQMTTVTPTSLDMTTLDMTTLDVSSDEMTSDEEMMTAVTTMSTTTSTYPTTTRPIRRSSKHKRSRKIIKKKSCYPATCILRKLNLLDSMGQPSIMSIQTFAVNMNVDDSKSLEEKAVGCVKEINEAMIDASGDIGKKVGCVAQKVITCLNNGLTCPIMKVSQ